MSFVPKPAKPIYTAPKKAQQMIPISEILDDGIFCFGDEASIMGEFSDINFSAEKVESKRAIAGKYEALFNAIGVECAVKLLLVSKPVDKELVMAEIQMLMQNNPLDYLRVDMNEMNVKRELEGKHGFEQKRYFILTVKRSKYDVVQYFKRITQTVAASFTELGSHFRRLSSMERLNVLYDFYRQQDAGKRLPDGEFPKGRGFSVQDYIAPDGFDFPPIGKYFRVGNRFGRVLAVQDFANTLKEDMLIRLMSLPREMFLSFDIIQKDKDETVRFLRNKQDNLEMEIAKATKNATREGNYNHQVSHTKQKMREEIRETLDILDDQDQRICLTQISIVHMADSLEQLDFDTREIQSIGGELSCRIGIQEHQQRQALNTALPYGPRYTAATPRPFTTENVATLIPFRTQELREPGGVIYGVNPISGNLLWVNRRDENTYQNGSGFIFGQPGSGKSMTGKLEKASVLLNTDEDVMIIDPENEYQAFVELMGGQYIRLAPGSKHFINAMEPMRYSDPDDDPISIKCSYLVTLIGAMINDQAHYGSYEKSLITRCAQIVLNDAEKTHTTTTLVDLLKCIKLQEDEGAKKLAVAIERFALGDSALNIFAKETNVDMGNRLVCFGVRDLGKELRPTGMYVVMDAIFNRITMNKYRGKFTRADIEEVVTLTESPTIEAEIGDWFRRCRKYGGIVTGLTQNVTRLLESPIMETMLSNSEFVIMLKSNDRDRKKLQELFRLSDAQVNALAGAAQGCGLFKAGNSIVPLDGSIDTSMGIYKSITTKLSEAHLNEA